VFGTIFDLKAVAVWGDARLSKEIEFFDPLLPLFVQLIHHSAIRTVKLRNAAQRITGTREMVEKVVRQGRTSRRGEAYLGLYVESLSDARAKLTAFFNILLQIVFRPAHR
jgi:hypothetical protein